MDRPFSPSSPVTVQVGGREATVITRSVSSVVIQIPVGSQNSVASKISILRAIDAIELCLIMVTRTVREPFVQTLEPVIGHTDNIYENDNPRSNPQLCSR